MFRDLSVLCIFSLCISALNVSATRLQQPKINLEQDLSSKEHYNAEEHNPDYDHEAFLGQELALEWQKLPTEIVIEKLRELFPKIDVDGDNKVSSSELYGWIEQHMKKHVLHGADVKMQDLDTNKDGKVSWEEYKESEYPVSVDEGLTEKALEELTELESRDKRRFEFADTDNDNQLSREELTLFLHPEESKRMTSYLIEENMEVFDKDKDGKVSLEEYLGEGVDQMDLPTREALTRSFHKELDMDKDGSLDRKEIKQWILPGVDDDPVQTEVTHLMKEADDDKDNFLTKDELVKHYKVFAGSRVTRYGDLLKEEL